MAIVNLVRNTTLPSSSDKADFHNLIDTATGTISAITGSDIAQITTNGKVAGSALYDLSETPSGAGVFPAVNVAQSLASGFGLFYDGTRIAASQATQIPAGSVIPFAGATAPTGYLLCDGSAVSRSTYAGLFTIIGETYGAGDGSFTFNVPSLGGKVPVGKSAEAEFNVLGETGGAKTVTLTAAQSGLPAHTHTDAMYNANGWATGDGVQASAQVSEAGNLTTDANVAANASEAHNNLQPYITLNYIIKF